MAAEPQQGAISAAFPAPPPFYKSFTTQNLESLPQLIEPASEKSPTQTRSTETHLLSVADLPPVPAEFRNLIPPAPPADGKYRLFGELHDVNPPPAALQTIPTRENLLGLTDRLMHLFHRYVQIMATNPNGELWVPQWEEIKRTFEQVHGIINDYRPHEARENLILRYEDQIVQVREESEQVKDSIEKARGTMEELGKGSLENGSLLAEDQEARTRRTAGLNGKKDLPKTKEQVMWELIERGIGKA